MDTMDAGRISGPPEKQVVQDLHGRRFYLPGVIGTYCVLSLPIGLYLYGLNVVRRGERVMGYILASISAVMFLAMIAAAAIGTRLTGFGIMGIFIGIGLFNMERGPYRAALARGGLIARWWPPLLWCVGFVVAVGMVLTIFGPAKGME